MKKFSKENNKYYFEYKQNNYYKNTDDFKIHENLYRLGISANLKGYTYILDALKIVKTKKNIKITKDIYNVLATKYNTKSCNIESAIRKSIEIGLNRAYIEQVDTMFKNTICFKRGKPTNFEFIITLSKNIW